MLALGCEGPTSAQGEGTLPNDLSRWFGVSDFIPWFLLFAPGLPDGFISELNRQWILFRWMGQGISLPPGGSKKLLLSTGEHGYPVLGHPNPTSKSLCPGLPRMSWESTPYLDNLHVDIIIITVLYFQDRKYIDKEQNRLAIIYISERRCGIWEKQQYFP